MDSNTTHASRIVLKPGREKPVLHGHPWVFSGAVARWEDEAEGVADVLASDGRWLARGLGLPGASLAVRLYSWKESELLDAALLLGVADRAVNRRESVFAGREAETDAYRLIYGEADGLSGLIADRYAGVLSVEVSSKALIPYLGTILHRLRERTSAKTICVAAAADAVERERLDPAALRPFATDESAIVKIRENGFVFEVQCGSGQKTGYFLDQRENRRRAAAYAKSRRVLSAYCYTGGFDVAAGGAGAAGIVGIDRSEPALELARRHHEMNRTRCPVEYRRTDVPAELRRMAQAGERFGMVILDPPRFVAASAQKEKGLRAYKDINRLAMEVLEPGGILASFSCSGLVSSADFKMMIGWSSVDARRRVRILETLGQPSDHPVLAVFPESEYLKGVIAEVE
jgi:23S rRNA (cytosine1962-C5)-methyltransferase